MGGLLTPRQREVAELHHAGYGVRRIARLLGISPRAVRAHIDAMRRKYGKVPQTDDAPPGGC